MKIIKTEYFQNWKNWSQDQTRDSLEKQHKVKIGIEGYFWNKNLTTIVGTWPMQINCPFDEGNYMECGK